jgi:outer membrane protein OmpA-like peptidoglycan-associated protein
MIRILIGASSAMAVAALLIGDPASAAGSDPARCNVVINGSGRPVIQSDGNVIAYGDASGCAAAEAEATVAAVTAPAPAPSGPESAVVYFDTGATKLDAEGRAAIDKLIAELNGSEVSSIAVAGFADTQGTPERNQRLAQLRANNVASEFVKAGLPARVVDTESFGESNLAVPTGDNISEEKNRRVEIKFTY